MILLSIIKLTAILCVCAIGTIYSCLLESNEIIALEDLYLSTDGANWSWKNESIYGPIWDFNHTSSICGSSNDLSWQGIVCKCNNNVVGNLLSLDLSSYNLFGRIVDDFPFYNLIALNLENNSLSGSIPSNISNLISLQELSLFKNNLDGSIPNEIGNLRNLSYLSLYSNHLTGSLPISVGDLTNLQYLYLHLNRFSGTIPSEVGYLSQLTDFWVYQNYFSGTIPESIGNLEAITKLYINHNEVTGTIPSSFSGLTNLIGLDLAVNALSGTLPPFLLSFPKLRTISMVSNCFNGQFPTGICSDSNAGQNLEVIVMDGLSSSSSCQENAFYNKYKPSFVKGSLLFFTLSGSLPNCLWTLPNLTTLHVSGNGLQGEIQAIADHSSLDDVAVSHNLLGGSIPVSVQLHEFATRFDVSSNRLSGELSSDYEISNEQQYLQLSVNRISGNLPNSFLTVGDNMTTLDVLIGNRFQCKNDKLPSQDPYDRVYTCGSSDLDDAVYSWAGFMVTIILGACLWAYLVSIANIDSNVVSVLRESVIGSSNNSDQRKSVKSRSFKMQSPSSMKRFSSNMTFNPYWPQWARNMIIFMSRNVMYMELWLKETSSVNLSSYEDRSNFGHLGDMSIPQTILFLEFTRIIGYWSTIIILYSMLVILPFNIASNVYGFSSVEATYGYVISSVYLRGIGPSIFLSISLSMLLFKIKFDSNFHRLKAVAYLARRHQPVSMNLNKYWKGILKIVVNRNRIIRQETEFESSVNPIVSYNAEDRHRIAFDISEAKQTDENDESRIRPSSSSLISQTFLPSPTKRTFINYLATFFLHLFNLSLTAFVNILYVNSIDRDQFNSATFLMLQVLIGTFKFVWSVTYIPWACKQLQNQFGKPVVTVMTHRYIMLVINYLVSPCIATLISNQSCFYYIFRAYDNLTAEFSDSVCNFAYNASLGIIECRTETIEYFLAVFSPPFLYSYNCSSALLVAYTPVLLYAYSIAGMVLPFIRLQLLRNPTLKQYLIPLKFLRELNGSNRFLEKNDGRVVLDGKSTMVVLMLHITVLLTFGLAYPMLGFAVAFTIVGETFTYKLTMGKFLYITTKVFHKRNMPRESPSPAMRSTETKNDSFDILASNKRDLKSLDSDKTSVFNPLPNPSVHYSPDIIQRESSASAWNLHSSIGLNAESMRFDSEDHRDSTGNIKHGRDTGRFDAVERWSDNHCGDGVSSNDDDRGRTRSVDSSFHPSKALDNDLDEEQLKSSDAESNQIRSSSNASFADAEIIIDPDEERIIQDFKFDDRLTSGGKNYAMKVLEESNADAWTGVHACIWYMITTVCWFWGLIFFDMAADEVFDIVLGFIAVILVALLLPFVIFLTGRVRYHPYFIKCVDTMTGLFTNAVERYFTRRMMTDSAESSRDTEMRSMSSRRDNPISESEVGPFPETRIPDEIEGHNDTGRVIEEESQSIHSEADPSLRSTISGQSLPRPDSLASSKKRSSANSAILSQISEGTSPKRRVTSTKDIFNLVPKLPFTETLISEDVLVRKRASTNLSAVPNSSVRLASSPIIQTKITDVPNKVDCMNISGNDDNQDKQTAIDDTV